jgi:hypothetical protein
MSRLASRLARLEHSPAFRRPGECEAPRITCLIAPGEPVPAGGATCPTCGGVHALEVLELPAEESCPHNGGF